MVIDVLFVSYDISNETRRDAVRELLDGLKAKRINESFYRLENVHIDAFMTNINYLAAKGDSINVLYSADGSIKVQRVYPGEN